MCSFWRMAFASTYMFSLVTKKQFKFSNNFALELPPNILRFNSTTFSLVCENPLHVEYWQIFNEFEDITGGTKHPISLATIRVAILLQYVPKGLESCMYGRSKRSLTRKLGQADRRGQRKRKAKKFLCSLLPPGIIAFSPNHVYVQICQKNPVIWSFGLLYFTCLPSPSLLPCFTSGHKEELILYKRTLLNKTVRLGRGFCWTRMIQQRLLSRVWIRIERLIPVKSWCLSDCLSN